MKVLQAHLPLMKLLNTGVATPIFLIVIVIVIVVVLYRNRGLAARVKNVGDGTRRQGHGEAELVLADGLVALAGVGQVAQLVVAPSTLRVQNVVESVVLADPGASRARADKVHAVGGGEG